MTTHYQYDGAGERILKTTGSAQTLYLRGMASYPLVVRSRTGGSETGVMVYIYGAGGQIAQHAPGHAIGAHYVVSDHLGSARVLYDGADGVPVAAYAYAVMGQQTQVWQDRARYTYTGQEWDTESGVYNYRARLYDPELGRFYAVDPQEQFYTPYVYVGNNPVSFIDPTGEIGFLAVVGIFAGVNLAADALRGDINSGRDLVMSLGEGAVMGSLAAVTGGASFAGANGGWLALSQAISSQLPSVYVPLGQGYGLSLSPSIVLGSGKFGVGGSVSIAYNGTVGGMSLGVGGFYGKNLGPKGLNYEFNPFARVRFGTNDFSLSTGGYGYHSSTETSQYTGFAELTVFGVSLGLENDGNLPHAWQVGDGRDRYRTAAGYLSYKEFSVGFVLYTGDPLIATDGEELDRTDDSGQVWYNTRSADRYRFGAAYVSYGSYRLGYNHERIRHLIQNKIAHTYLSPESPFFNVLPSRGSLYYHYSRNEYLPNY